MQHLCQVLDHRHTGLSSHMAGFLPGGTFQTSVQGRGPRVQHASSAEPSRLEFVVQGPGEDEAEEELQTLAGGPRESWLSTKLHVFRA